MVFGILSCRRILDTSQPKWKKSSQQRPEAGCRRFAPYFGANASTSSGRALGRETVLRIRRKLALRDRARSIPAQSQPSLLRAGSHDESCSIPTLRALLPDKSVWRVDGRRTFLVLPLTSAAKAGIP